MYKGDHVRADRCAHYGWKRALSDDLSVILGIVDGYGGSGGCHDLGVVSHHVCVYGEGGRNEKRPYVGSPFNSKRWKEVRHKERRRAYARELNLIFDGPLKSSEGYIEWARRVYAGEPVSSSLLGQENLERDRGRITLPTTRRATEANLHIYL